MFFALIKYACEWTEILWNCALAFAIIGRALLPEKSWRAAARVHQMLWPFAPPGLVFLMWHDWTGGWRTSWMLVFMASAAWQWWHYRDWPEDNHTKRRLKKAKEAVSARFGRLVVVPVS